MKPTIGRIVLFATKVFSRNGEPPVERVFPAIITAVKQASLYVDEKSEPSKEPSSAVDLFVFGHYDVVRDHAAGEVRDVPFSPLTQLGYWSWPPKV